MATTPSPVMQGLKSFWQRPEGTVGKIILVVAGLAVAYGFVQLLPFLIAAATDTLHLALLVAGLLIVVFVITDHRVRTLAKLIFQSAVRYLTGLFIELDPIGILKNYIAEMKKNLAVMDEQLGNLNGSIKTLQNQIDTNQKETDHSVALANQIYDQTLEYLADDAGQMLGEMEDFNRLANKLMTNMDLETGALNDEAVKQLNEFQQKLLPAAATPAITGGTSAQAVAVPAKGKDDFSDLIR